MKLKDISSECQRCANLKAWNINMNGEHDYCCKCKPSKLVCKEFHTEHCDKFIDKDCSGI